MSCSSFDAKTENKSFPKDPSLRKLSDSAQLPKFNDLTFVVESGFLPSIFRDTAQVRVIQKYVNQIKKQKFEDSVELEEEQFLDNVTDGGGSLIGYFQNGQLLQVKEWVGLSYGVTQRNFYLKKGQLVCVLETEDDFYVDDSSGTDHSVFGQHFRGDYYFTNNKLVDVVTLGHNRFEIDTNDPEEQFVKLVTKYQKLILNERNQN